MLDTRWDQTAYDLHGSENAPSLVLVHGLRLHRGLWRQFLPALSAHYRALTYDLYGHGKSGPSTETASLDLYTKQLHGLMNHVGISSATIAGFSLGGMINRRFARAYSTRFRTGSLSVKAMCSSLDLEMRKGCRQPPPSGISISRNPSPTV
ncbi:alpha/beta fold hydrolase [Paracoccus alkanivorans]|uniref:alpha/beta fold hydrolase n=1 Tax=Paracoccus alkanivorans TaxID=2116655 RepID=UPI00140B2CF8